MDENHQEPPSIHGSNDAGGWVRPFSIDKPLAIMEWCTATTKIVFYPEQYVPMFIPYKFYERNHDNYNDYTWDKILNSTDSTIRIASFADWQRFVENPIPFVMENLLE